MATRTGRGGTVRGGKKAGKGADAPQQVEAAQPKAGGEGGAPAAAAAGGGGNDPLQGAFDGLADAYNSIMKLTADEDGNGGQPPDISEALAAFVTSGVSKDQILAGMSARGIDVSQTLAAIPDSSPKAPAAPEAPQAEPPTNMGKDDLAPVEATNNLPEPPPAPAAAVEAAAPAAEAAPAPAAAPMAAATGFPTPEIVERLRELGFAPEDMDMQSMFDTYTSLQKQGYFDDGAVAAPPAPEATVADSPVVTGPMVADSEVVTPTPQGQPLAGLRDPSPTQAAFASIPPVQGPAPQAPTFDGGNQPRVLSPRDIAFSRVTSNIPPSVLARMTGEQLQQAMNVAVPQAPATSPIGGLMDNQPITVSSNTPAPAGPSPAATTPPVVGGPVAGLSDAAPNLAASPEPAPLNMTEDANPYSSDIYTQLAQATMGGGQVEQVYAPQPTARPAPAPQTVNPEFAAGTASPNMQVNLGTYVPGAVAPGVMDVGALVPGGVGPAAARTQWRDGDGNLNSGGGGGGDGGGGGGNRRNNVIAGLQRMMMGTPAEGDKPAQMGLLSTELTDMFRGQGGGPMGKLTRAASSPRLLTPLLIAELLRRSGGAKNIATNSGVAGYASQVYNGMEPTEEQPQQGPIDYSSNISAALERVKRPASSRQRLPAPSVPDLASPMMPNYSRP